MSTTLRTRTTSTTPTARGARAARGRRARRAGSVAVKLCAVVAAGALTGCFWATTKAEGQRLRKDVDDLDARLGSKEEDLQSKVEKLQAVLDEATKVLQRNSADLGADVQKLDEDIRATRGLITAAKTYTDEVGAALEAYQQKSDNERDVLQKRIESLEQRLAELEKRFAEPSSADDLYAAGKSAFDGGNWNDAHKYFKRLVLQFPGHDRADDAQYYRGEAYFKVKDYDGAIREFQKVFDKYESSSLADDALYRAGEAAQLLRRCTESRAYFGLLRQKFPKSELVSKARAKDAQLKKDARNKKKCLG